MEALIVLFFIASLCAFLAIDGTKGHLPGCGREDILDRRAYFNELMHFQVREGTFFMDECRMWQTFYQKENDPLMVDWYRHLELSVFDEDFTKTNPRCVEVKRMLDEIWYPRGGAPA